MFVGHDRVTDVGTLTEFEKFCTVLDSPSRPPLLVATLAEGDGRPAIDVDKLVDELGDAVLFYVLSPAATFWLTDRLGRALTVHSGWVRVYPASAAWRSDPSRSRSFRPAPSHRQRTIQQIVDFSLEAAFRDGAVGPSSAAPPVGTPCTAVVRDIATPTQAFVKVDGRSQAVMRTSHLAIGIPAERLVRRGQTFAGRFTTVGMFGEFVPDPVVVDNGQRAAEFVGEGLITSVRVASVAKDRIELQLLPDVEIDVIANPGEDLSGLASVGDVVTAEVVRVDGEFVATFSSDEPGPAMAILPGGPPWLTPAPVVALLEDESPPLAGPSEADREGLGATKALEEELERLEARRLEDLATIRQLQRDLRVSRTFAVPVVFRDPVEQLRLELYLGYLSKVPEADRVRFPWPETFDIGVDFVASMTELVEAGGISRERIVDVCVDVLCGRAKTIPSRAVKEWKTPNGPAQRRATDRAVRMRVRLQVGSPAARRLGYWVKPNGEIELDSVCVHDAGLGK